MNAKTTLSLEEIALFRDSVSDVKRVRSDKIAQHPSPPAPVAHQTRLDKARVMDEILDFGFNSTELQPGDHLNFCRPGVQHAVMRKLRRGHYRVTAELDLHGMNTDTARRALIEFIQQAKAAGARCVRVVHGKGRRSNNRGPVIKPLVGHILRRSGDVLAFCSARPVDGGTGAVYVLLKSP
jgi:DNA-nicking Smr family endonuclease